MLARAAPRRRRRRAWCTCPRPRSTTARRAWATSTRTRDWSGDDADDYAVTKRDTDAALAEVDGITRVLVRPPAILGAGETSVWNSLRPAAMRDDERARHAVPEQTFAWVHVDDLATLVADVASGAVATVRRPASAGRSRAAARPSTWRAGPATLRDYLGAVTARARRGAGLGRRSRVDRADPGRPRPRAGAGRRRVDLAAALAEIDAGLRPDPTRQPRTRQPG